jgi:predicted nucleotidyltransferase
MTPVWEADEFKEDVLWAGIFGSVMRNRPYLESDVDIACIFKDHLRSGEPIDLRERESCRGTSMYNPP